MSLPLIISQIQQIQNRAKVLLMRINKWIHGGPIFKVDNFKTCKEIGNPLPEQEILQANSRLIQKLMSQKEKVWIKNHIAMPNCSTSRNFHKCPKKKSYRTALEHHINLYSQLPAAIKYLKPKTFSAKLKKLEIEYKPID